MKLAVGLACVFLICAHAEEAMPPASKRAWLACYKTDGCFQGLKLGKNAVIRCPKLDNGSPDIPKCEVTDVAAVVEMQKARIELK